MQFYKYHLKIILLGCVFCYLTVGVIIGQPIRLASTTSTENSGLLKFLIPIFEKKSGYKVNVIVAGTGQALRMGEDGNVDVLLVHAPNAETRFVESGFGLHRMKVMSNDFVFVGPKDDPAGIFGESDALIVLKKIFHNKQAFVSRGDDSGTHKKELSLWERVKLKPEIYWYREVGQGMGRVLQMSDELNAYTLTDRGTWLSMRSKLSLKLLSEGDQLLNNPYSIIAVNPRRHSKINYSGAMALIEWLTSFEGQDYINDFKIDGENLFFPIINNKSK